MREYISISKDCYDKLDKIITYMNDDLGGDHYPAEEKADFYFKYMDAVLPFAHYTNSQIDNPTLLRIWKVKLIAVSKLMNTLHTPLYDNKFFTTCRNVLSQLINFVDENIKELARVRGTV